MIHSWNRTRHLRISKRCDSRYMHHTRQERHWKFELCALWAVSGKEKKNADFWIDSSPLKSFFFDMKCSMYLYREGTLAMWWANTLVEVALWFRYISQFHLEVCVTFTSFVVLENTSVTVRKLSCVTSNYLSKRLAQSHVAWIQITGICQQWKGIMYSTIKYSVYKKRWKAANWDKTELQKIRELSQRIFRGAQVNSVLKGACAAKKKRERLCYQLSNCEHVKCLHWSF